jgi:hypothetical protein
MWRYAVHLSLLALTLLTAPVAGSSGAPTAMPQNLNVPQQNVVHLKAHATGVQIYACKAKVDDPDAFAWTFKAPVADLWNEHGEKVGTHYAGPTWEWYDGSTVVRRVLERASAPAPDAIPWLLLQATSSHGAGRLTPVTYVQRLETVGGVAPSNGCDPSVAEAELAVEYTATYLFSVWRGDIY